MNETTAVEDLMREHGLLNRILIIYEEIIYRYKTTDCINQKIILISAYIIRKFIEDYHEKIEEEYIFPIFLKKGVLCDTINELQHQHNLGRILTDSIIKRSMEPMTYENATLLIESMSLFIKMYRIHEAREDTVVFPEFKKLLTKKEYEKLGDKFEQIERETFGPGGFEKNLAMVELIEKELNIFSLERISTDIQKFIQDPYK